MPRAKKPLEIGGSFYFYDKSVELRFSPTTHTYYRVHGDELIPQDGVTTICGILDKSMYLMPWAVKMMEQKLLRIIPQNETKPQLKPIAFAEFQALVKDAKSAHRDIKEDAADVGHMAHSWLEDSIRGAIAFTDGIVEKMKDPAPEDERARSCGMAGFDWMQKHNVRWLKTEQKVYSREWEYAGTMDGLALVDSCTNKACCPRVFIDELSLIDWKSSNALRIEYLYQTAAYQHAEQEEHGTKIKARWILRLGKEDGEFEPWYETNFTEDFNTFLCCLALKRAHYATEKRMSDAKKIRTASRREERKNAKQAKES